MADRSVLEQYDDFGTASARAKVLATQHADTVTIMRTASGWAVCGRDEVLSSLIGESDDEPYEVDAGTADGANDLFEEEYQRTVVEPIIEEMQDDQEGWARSEDEGWFYDD